MRLAVLGLVKNSTCTRHGECRYVDGRGEKTL